ncbi:MAG: cytochrome o ubiquinol oxidase subunit IV [Rhodanobacteraceae bacterium]|nr:MAG: cytochrome o ubiquinol oxidase subunit IV [Rhodanobacteraceae bacterium]
MSNPSAPGHSPAQGHEGAMHENHGSLRGYLTGFVLAAILTVIPFWLVLDHIIGDFKVAVFVILALATLQIIVHMIFFLHVNVQSEGGWNLMGLLFTITLVVIVLGASIWSMFNENNLMMPTMSVPIQQYHAPAPPHSPGS